MKIVKTRAYNEKLKGHKQSVLRVHSPQGPEGQLLYSVCSGGELFAWDLLQKEVHEQFSLRIEQKPVDFPEKHQARRRVNCAEFSGNIVYTGMLTGDVISWSIQTGELIDRLQWHKQPVNLIRKINNRVLLTAGEQGRVVLWDTTSGSIDKSYQFVGPVVAVQYTEPVLHALHNRKTVTTMNLETNAQVFRKQAPDGKYFVRLFQLKGGFLLQTSDCDLEFYARMEEPAKWVIPFHNTWINQVKFVNKYLLCGCDDSSLRVVNPEKKQIIDELRGHTMGINTMEMAFGKLFTGSSECSILSWELKEVENHLRQRRQMANQELESRKHEVYMKYMSKPKRKTRGKKSRSKGRSSKGKPSKAPTNKS